MAEFEKIFRGENSCVVVKNRRCLRVNQFIASSVEAGQWDRVIDYVNNELFGKPDEYYSLDKLRKAAAVDRRLPEIEGQQAQAH